jgi:hypothetical protein
MMVERARDNLQRYKAKQPLVGQLLPYLTAEEATQQGLNFREAHGWIEGEKTVETGRKSCLDQFQVTTAVPIRDRLLIFFDFPAARCRVMVDEVVAQVLPGKLALFKQVCCLRQVARE